MLVGAQNGGVGLVGQRSAGRGTVRSGKLPRDAVSVTFEVLGLSAESLGYDQAENTDPDEDSNGTTITVERP